MQPKIKTPFPTLAPKGKEKKNMCVVERIPKKTKNKTKQNVENEGKCVW
jgi:hypothetical protein